jgi:hypothetical protein
MLRLTMSHDVCTSTTPLMYCAPMPTAIVRIYTPEGFVIAADGYSDDADAPALNCQKIFATSGTFGTLAFGISMLGGASFTNDVTGANLRIVFGQECQHTAEKLQSYTPRSLNEYAEKFSRLFLEQVQLRIAKGVEEGIVSDSDYSGWKKSRALTLLHFAGYIASGNAGNPLLPSMATYTVRLADGSVEPGTALLNISHSPAVGFFYGSQQILSILQSEGAQFSKHSEREQDRLALQIWQQYSKPAHRDLKEGRGISLSSAIEAATSYIQACSDVKARKIDQQCHSIGGRIHVGTITFEDAFKWVPNLEPSDST